MGLDNQVQKLEKKLKLIKPVFSDKPTDRFRNKLKRVAYPVVTRDLSTGQSGQFGWYPIDDTNVTGYVSVTQPLVKEGEGR